MHQKRLAGARDPVQADYYRFALGGSPIDMGHRVVQLGI